MKRYLLFTIAVICTASGCGNSESESSTSTSPSEELDTNYEAWPYENLSEYRFFQGNLADLNPNDGVYWYEVNSELWTDGARKTRFLVPAQGTTVEPTELEDWELAAGSAVIKNFAFSTDERDPSGAYQVIETRLFIRTEDGWSPQTYVWNEDQTDAIRLTAGELTSFNYLDENGEPTTQDYMVPNTNQCNNCHERDDATRLLGLVTPQLNRQVTRDNTETNQLDWLTTKGVFANSIGNTTDLLAFTPPFGDGELEDRARSYLHANCSHCHRPGGGASDSGLVLLQWETDPATYGVCKKPAAAGTGTGGLAYDIDPGSADTSIMIYRISSTDPAIKMPELGNLIVHEDGVALLREWIDGMTLTCE